MKIIFDSEEEKKQFIEKLAEGLYCPEDAPHVFRIIPDYREYCRYMDCEGCWREAIDNLEEVKNEDNI